MLIAARTLFFGGITGKVLGVARELITAALFGTGTIAAAYRLAQAAFLIPLHGFLSDAFSAGFTPAYARCRDSESGQARALFATMHLITLGVALLAGVLLATFAARWVGLLAPGFNPSAATLATQMVLVMSGAMPFYALTGLYASAELADGNAGMAAARASVQSLGLIGGALVAWWTGNAIYLGAGFLLAYVVLALWGLRAALTQGLPLWPGAEDWAAARDSLRSVWTAFRFLFLIPVLLQGHFIVERRVASWVHPQAVAALDYARFLSDTAVLLLAVPLGLAGIGAMANLNHERFTGLAWRSLRLLLYVGVPLSVLLALHGRTVVHLIFARGAFNQQSVDVTAAILQTLAIGLWAQLIGYAGAKYLSARSRNRRVVLIYAAALGLNVAINQGLYLVTGVATLGIASAANSIVFGLLILHSLGLLARMAGDLTLLAVLAAGYALLWSLAPPAWDTSVVAPALAFAGYWGIAAVAVPRCRSVIHDAWLSLRPA